MSDPKPDRILAEESDNPWVKLILWSNEHPLDPTHRWNGFMKYVVKERLSLLKPSNVTGEQRQAAIEFLRINSVEFKRAWPLSYDELEHARNFFPDNTNFKKDQLHIKIDNLISARS